MARIPRMNCAKRDARPETPRTVCGFLAGAGATLLTPARTLRHNAR